MENGGRERAQSFQQPRMSQDISPKYKTATPALFAKLRLNSTRRKQNEEPTSPAIDDLICLDSFDEAQEDVTPRPEVSKETLRATIVDQLRGVGSQLDVFRDVDVSRIESYRDCSQIEKNLAFLAAAFLNRYQLYEQLIEYGSDESFSEPIFGFSALHMAAFCGSKGFCEKIIKRSATLPLTTGVLSPLHLAAYGGNPKVIQQLLSAGACIDRLHQSGETPLASAVRSHNKHCVKTLLNAGADVNVMDAYGCTPLHLATDLGDVEIARLLLETGRCDVDASSRAENNTALHLASANAKTDMVQVLLEAGATVDSRNARLKTPLHLASRVCPECTDCLLKKGADPNATDVDQRTPLHTAVAKSEVRSGADILELLLKWRASVNAQDRYGYTALHIAALNELADSAEVLIMNGADITKRTKGGTAALGLVARKTPSVLQAVWSNLDRYITCNDEVSHREVEMKFNFKYLLQGCQRGEMNFLRTVIDEGQRHLLEHPLCEAFLHLKWQKIRFYYLARLIFCFIFVVLLSTYVLVVLGYQCYDTTKPDLNEHDIRSRISPPKIHFDVSLCANKSRIGVYLRQHPSIIENEWLVLAIVTVLEIIRKLYGMNGYRSLRSYFSLSNIVEWFVIAAVPATSYAVAQAPWQNHVGAFAVLVGWANLMVMVGNLPMFGTYVAMYTSVQKEFAKLLSAYICLLIGFTVSFCAIFVKAETFENPLVGFVKILVMMTGEFEFGNLLADINHEDGAQILEASALLTFVLFLLFVTIILINLLIGIAVSDIQGLQKTAGLSKLVQLTKLLNHIEAALFGREIPTCVTNLLTSTCGVPSLLTVSPLRANESRLPRKIVRDAWEIVKRSRVRRQDRRRTFSIKRTQNVSEGELDEIVDAVTRLSEEINELKKLLMLSNASTASPSDGPVSLDSTYSVK